MKRRKEKRELSRIFRFLDYSCDSVKKMDCRFLHDEGSTRVV